jgi:hypothetical protein
MAGGSKMIDRHLKSMNAIEGKKVETGWFSTNRYSSGDDGKLEGRSVAEVAKLNEFGGTISHPGGTKYIEDAIVKGAFVGTRFVGKDFEGEHKVTAPHVITIPPRPFMRLAAKKFGSSRAKVESVIAAKLAKGEVSITQAMNQIGLAMQGEIVDSIKNGGWTPNAPSTIARKGSEKPLIESAQMWQSVTIKVS